MYKRQSSEILRYKYSREFKEYIEKIYVCNLYELENFPFEKVDYVDSFYKKMALTRVMIGKGKLYSYAFIAFAVIAVAFYVLKYTKFGRSVYALGGNEQSAVLMGLPVARTKIAVMEKVCYTTWR